MFFFFESQAVLMLPLLKHAEQLHSSLDRLKKRLRQMNPNDFRHKMLKSRLEMFESAAVSYRLVFENKSRQQGANRFYRRLLERTIAQHR